MSIPARTSTTGKDHTVTIVYDQPLDEDSPPLLTDYVIALSATPLTIESVIVLNVAGKGTVFVGTTERQFPGLLSIGAFTAGRLQNLDGELAPAFSGESIVNATGAADTAAPNLLTGRIDADEISLYFDEVLDALSAPAVAAFGVEVDDVAVAATGVVTIYGTRARFHVVETADTGDIVSLTYAPPGVNNLTDLDGPNDVAAISWPILLENLTENQVGFWTDRQKVERKFGKENTRIWSNNGDTETTDANPITWQEALDDTDAKFNSAIEKHFKELNIRRKKFGLETVVYVVPPYAADSTSADFARLKILAKIWAGTELYFARGSLDESAGGNNQVERDKMQGWRNYVETELSTLFSVGLDVDQDDDLRTSVSTGALIQTVQPDLCPVRCAADGLPLGWYC